MDLSHFAPEPVVVALGPATANVSPLTVAQLGPFTRAIIPIIDALSAALVEGANGDVTISRNALLQLMVAAPDDLATAVSIATGLSIDVIQTMPAGYMAVLAVAVLEVNLDFFVRQAMPMLTASVARLKTLKDKAKDSNATGSA